jgi:hypothetical protein
VKSESTNKKIEKKSMHLVHNRKFDDYDNNWLMDNSKSKYSGSLYISTSNNGHISQKRNFTKTKDLP